MAALGVRLRISRRVTVGFEVQMECTQTEVGEHSEVGYRSGERLPVGHKDVSPGWVPVIVEVDDPLPPPPPVQMSATTKTTTTAAPAAKTGVKSHE
jgi:hypothetical protein